jgi:hypothetical protein
MNPMDEPQRSNKTHGEIPGRNSMETHGELPGGKFARVTQRMPAGACRAIASALIPGIRAAIRAASEDEWKQCLKLAIEEAERDVKQERELMFEGRVLCGWCVDGIHAQCDGYTTDPNRFQTRTVCECKDEVCIRIRMSEGNPVRRSGPVSSE